MKYLCSWCFLEHEKLTPQEIKGIYSSIGARGAADIHDLRRLEHALRTDFEDTSDFHFKVNQFLTRKGGMTASVGQRIAKKRKREKLTQFQLAKAMGITKMMICHYEKDKREPSAKVLAWLNGENDFSGKSKQKVGSEGDSMDPPLFGGSALGEK